MNDAKTPNHEPPMDLSKLPNPKIDPEFSSLIEELSRGTHTSTATVFAARIEDWLKASITTIMRDDLSKSLVERIFDGYGPLSTFSAKIDIGYALKLFTLEIYNDLRAIKDIRNAFAHSKQTLYFDSVELQPLFQRMTGWTKDCDHQSLFADRLVACVTVFKGHIETKVLVQAIKTYRRSI